MAKPALLANVTVNASAPKSIEPVWLASSTEDTGPSFCAQASVVTQRQIRA